MNFTIKLDEQVSAPAAKAKGALAALDASIKSEGATLRALENQMRSVQKASVVDIQLHRQLSSAIDAQKNKVAGLTAEMVRSGGAGFKGASSLKSVNTEAAGLGETLGGVAGKAGLVAGAILGVASAVVYLGGKLLTLGVAASETKGDMTRTLELTYGSQKAAEHTYKVLENITGRIAISQDRVMALSDNLIKAGQVNGDRMVQSIESIGRAEAARKGAGQVLESVITRSQSSRMFSISRQELMAVGLSYREMAREISKQTGRGVADVEVQLRTGGVRLNAGLDALHAIVDRKMGKLADEKFMTVGAQTQRLKDGFTRLFEGMNTGPLAQGLALIANLLDENTVTGAAMRDILKLAFDGISAAIDKVGPYVELFFQGMELAILKAYNALYPLRKAIHNLFGGDQQAGLESFQDSMINFANNIAKGFATAAVALAWIIDKAASVDKFLDKLNNATGGASSVATTALVNPLGLLFKDWGGGSKDAAANDNAKASGKSVADGVAEGIRSGTPAVDAAMAAMGESAVKSFDNKMQIHSPSRVMAKRGEHINEGTAQGIERSAGRVGDAMAGVGGGIPGAMGSGGSGGGARVEVIFQPGAIVIQGGDPGAMSQLQARMTDLMADVFEQAALTRGAGAAA